MLKLKKKEKMKKPSKEEINEEMDLHNADEVGIDNQWTFEDAEYHLLLSDKYYQKQEYGVRLKGSVYLKDALNNHATMIDGKYFYLPVWFEKIENSNEYIMHHMENIPIELSSRIRSMREHVKPSKKEIEEYRKLHNEDEVGTNNQWSFDEAEYHLLLDDKYLEEETEYVCDSCGSNQVESKDWVEVNTGAVTFTYESTSDEDNWCKECKEHCKIIEKNKK